MDSVSQLRSCLGGPNCVAAAAFAAVLAATVFNKSS
ncbi:rCG30459 [Rattus norvegicus]|uniref:RCG30459 n=1 Tax=Rattus norvegicus TaxID=10116 RepID=A6JFH1_RAT|nr:rCG30459 [Rattus norvegicus]